MDLPRRALRTRSKISRACLFTVLLVQSICVSCKDGDNVNGPSGSDLYHVPVQIDDGWPTASLSDLGMNIDLFDRLNRDLENIPDHNIHSLLIVKDGVLVFEKYFQGDKFNLAQYTGETGFDMEDTHNLCSATKSFTSAMIGIAIDQGYIQSVNDNVFDYFPQYADLFTNDSVKSSMTIENLLTMMSGLDWDDETMPYSDPRNDMYQMFTASDPIRYVLSQGMDFTPGTHFDYDNGNTNVLGEIIRQATEFRIDDFCNRFMFSKLGITDYEWQMISSQVVFTSGDLRLRPRDMAKFGQLFLNKGIWQGERIISENWVEVSTRKHVNPNNFTNLYGWAEGYGYQWWQWESDQLNAYFASGWGGQYIIVCPEYDLVFVTTGGNYYTAENPTIRSILTQYIIPSIEQE